MATSPMNPGSGGGSKPGSDHASQQGTRAANQLAVTPGPSASDYEIPPRISYDGFYESARKEASTDALFPALGLLVIGATAVGAVFLTKAALAAPTGFLVILVAGATYFIVLPKWTRSKQLRLHAAHVLATRRLLFDSIQRIEESRRRQTMVADLLRQCQGELLQAESEHKSRRFSVFWDRIEAVAGILAEVRNIFDGLWRLQQEYSTALHGMVHNLPAVLPGCSSMPADVALVQRFQSLIEVAQADIDFALIWEHRQTRAVMVAGFTTIGQMVQSIGVSVVQSLQQLIAIESAPRYSVGFIGR